MNEQYVLPKWARITVIIVQVILIIGILALVWFGRGDMNMFSNVVS
jgi:hypothetical protein